MGIDLQVEIVKKNATACLLGIFVFTILCPYTNAVQSMVVCLLYLIFVYRLWKQDSAVPVVKKHLLFLGILLFGAWAMVGLLFSLDPIHSIRNFEAHYLRYLMIYCLIVQEFRSKENVILFFWIVVISSVFFSFLSIINIMFIEGSYVQHVLILGTSKNTIGFMLILGIFYGVGLLREIQSWQKRLFLYVGIASLMIMSIIPQCRGTILGLAGAICVYLMCNRKAGVWLLFFAGFSLLILPLSSRVTDTFFHDPQRLELLNVNVKIIKDYPLFGTGMTHDPFFVIRDKHSDQFNSYLQDTRLVHVQELKSLGSPHMMLGQIAAVTGIPGAVFFSGILLSAFIILLNVIRDSDSEYIINFASCTLAAYSGFFIKSLFEPIFAHETDAVLYLIFSVTTILWLQEKQFAFGDGSGRE